MERVPLFVTILLTAMLSLGLFAALTATGGAKTIVVDDDWDGADFNNISAAVAIAENGDTIRVHSGYYIDRLRIDTRVNLIGNGSSDTYLRGSYLANETIYDSLIFIYIGNDHVLISGFNLSIGRDSKVYTVYFWTSYNILSDCEFPRGSRAVKVVDSPLTRREKANRILGCSFFHSGLDIEESYDNEVSNNTFVGYGIDLHVAWGSIVSDNTIMPGKGPYGITSGIHIYGAGNNIIVRNQIDGYENGISMVQTRNVTIVSNIIQNCDVGIWTGGFNRDLKIQNNRFIDNDLGMSISGESTPRTFSDNVYIGNGKKIEYGEEPWSPGPSYYNYCIAAIVLMDILAAVILFVAYWRKRRRVRIHFRSPHRSRRS